MKFNRTTKSALFTSVVSLFLCFAMLLGTTFAWFTDSATSAGNKIVAGTLDIDLYLHTGANEGDKVEITNESAPIFGAAGLAQDSFNTLWEPGKTQVAYLSLVNNGSLDLKYNVSVVAKNAKNDLHKVMEYAITPDAQYDSVTGWDAAAGIPVVLGNNVTEAVSVDLASGATHYFALSIHMLEEAGNEYQGGEIEFDIVVTATQTTSEFDSFDDQYDAAAPLPGVGSAYLAAGAASVNVQVIKNVDERPGQQDKVGSAEIPAEAIDPATKEVKVIIDDNADYKANITVAAGAETKAFDVKVEGLKAGNTTPVKVTLNMPAGLDPATVKLYHYDTEIACTYNPSTGLVTFESATFSPFTVVYDAESEYVAPEAPKDEEGNVTRPTAKVEYVGEYVNNPDIEWGNYGQWSPTEGLDANLEAAFVFTCPENLSEEVRAAFEYWYCDFYVSLDRDLAPNQIFLGGNYGDFGWIGFHNGDVTLKANEELPLLGSVTNNPWTYSDVESFVGTFLCGVGDVDDALEGATFTVKLRLTNPENEAEYYDVNVVTHTFGAGYSIDGNTIGLTNDGDLNDPNYAAWLQGLVDGN